MPTVRIELPRPDPIQQTVLDHPSRFKLLRWGRQRGKTTTAVTAAVAGHGPDRQFQGFLAGAPIVWLTPDYPQAREVWRVHLRSKFQGRPGFTLSESERRIDGPNGGSLEIRSAEAVDGIRGRKLGGIVIDEGAWLDLEYAWHDVIRPALLALEGWAVVISTTNAGLDGNSDHITPSYFNRLCEKELAGEMPDWWQHHQTTKDNPHLSVEEVDKIYAETSPGSIQRRQELDAELLAAGIGLAFPEWRTDLHTKAWPLQDIPTLWKWVAGMDWGYTAKGCIALAACGPEGLIHVADEYVFTEQTSVDVGYSFGMRLRRFPSLEWLVYDNQMDGVTDGGWTLAEGFRKGLQDAMGKGAPMLIPTPKGPGSRIAGKAIYHEALKWQASEDGSVARWNRPKLTFDSERCPYLCSSIPKLPRDPKQPEDVDKLGDTHGYDSVRYLLQARVPSAEVIRKDIPPDVHPGFTAYGARRKRERTPETEAQEALAEVVYTGGSVGGRYGIRRVV